MARLLSLNFWTCPRSRIGTSTTLALRTRPCIRPHSRSPCATTSAPCAPRHTASIHSSSTWPVRLAVMEHHFSGMLITMERSVLYIFYFIFVHFLLFLGVKRLKVIFFLVCCCRLMKLRFIRFANSCAIFRIAQLAKWSS